MLSNPIFGVTTWEANTVIYSVLVQFVSQEGLSHCCNVDRKHCNLQCVGASCLAKRLVPLLQYR